MNAVDTQKINFFIIIKFSQIYKKKRLTFLQGGFIFSNFYKCFQAFFYLSFKYSCENIVVALFLTPFRSGESPNFGSGFVYQKALFGGEFLEVTFYFIPSRSEEIQHFAYGVSLFSVQDNRIVVVFCSYHILLLISFCIISQTSG